MSGHDYIGTMLLFARCGKFLVSVALKNDAAKLIEIAPSVHDKSGPKALPNDLRDSDGTPLNSELK